MPRHLWLAEEAREQLSESVQEQPRRPLTYAAVAVAAFGVLMVPTGIVVSFAK